jgi:hypothetical protein
MGCTVSGTDDTEAGRGFALPFWAQMGLLVFVLVAVPLGGVWVLDLDGRTPQRIAEETLREKYDLVQVDANGRAVPEGSDAPTASEFDATEGAVSKKVPFLRHGEQVTCTVSMPDDDPRSIEAECEPAPLRWP